MKAKKASFVFSLLAWIACSSFSFGQDRVLLESWRDSSAKSSIMAFVDRVSTEGHPSFVPVSQRIAVFDNDGTLWAEQPMYVQLAFALDRVSVLAKSKPDLKGREPFRAALDRDLPKLAASGEAGLLQLIMETHAGMNTEEFSKISLDWITQARHPVYRRPYTECVYQPMLELMDYLRARGFTIYIVSGGGAEFIRPWAERVYGVPPSHVIGSTIKLRYEAIDGVGKLVRLPDVDFIDDKSGKPVAIHKFIGQHPIMAFGNSDGDYEMLEYVTSNSLPSLGVLIHHTDADRESRYDKDSHFGRLDRALRDAPARGWAVVDMAEDWASIFPIARENNPE